MRSSDETIQWLAALIISSATVAVTVFILEIVTAPKSSMLIDLAILEAHVENQPSVSDLSTEELAKDISFTFLTFVMVTTPIISLVALVPAFIFSTIWESWSKPPSTLGYAIGGLITGLAFSLIVLSPLAPLGPGFTSSPDLTPLRFIFLGAIAGLVGGLVFGWRRRAYFRLFQKTLNS